MEKIEGKSHRMWDFTSILAKSYLIPTVTVFQCYFSHSKISFVLFYKSAFSRENFPS